MAKKFDVSTPETLSPADYMEIQIDRMTYGFPVYNVVSLQEAARIVNNDDCKEKADIDNGTGRVARYRTYRDWYAGKHKVRLSARQEELFEASGIAFADNFIDTIVDTLVRRLKLKSFSFNPENEIADEETQQVMRKNTMDIGANKIHHVVVKLGDAFAILDYDMVRDVATISMNRPEIIRPEYDDDTGEIMVWASKCWNTKEVSPFNPAGKEICRLNVYYPNRIEKFYCLNSDKKTWLPYMDLDTDLLWPIPWVDMDTLEPIGIPVFHFKNKTLDGKFGVSEIHKAIPQQAMLNKALTDLDLILDTQGYPQRWASGVSEARGDTTQVDSNNNVVFDGSPGSVWHTPSSEAKFGQFDAAPVDGALKAIELLCQHISASNATPIWLLLSAGRFPSGESMKMGDSGLSDKASERALLFGNQWENVIRYCHRLRNLRAENQLGIDLSETQIEATWEDTTPRNEKVLVDTLSILVRELGASKRWALEKYGVENVADVMEEADAENQTSADTQLRSMIRGLPTAPAMPDTPMPVPPTMPPAKP